MNDVMPIFVAQSMGHVCVKELLRHAGLKMTWSAKYAEPSRSLFSENNNCKTER
ncbi:MAG: hypothetical protein ABF876_09665 [Acetobacter aceti]|uniref:hypothetical protein n=1 Tax=Acetobacter aceti TaxID=435 RepID=UPI001656CE38|nr:hypothetical protein [Acetobacter aceti]